jgi:hypothetical protein
MMRRLKNRRRVGVCLCGIAVATGCSRYLARQDAPAVAMTPANAAVTAKLSPSPAQGAGFDFEAVQTALASTSPYCPVQKPGTLDVPPAPAVARQGDLPDQGAPGVCVLRTTYPDAKRAGPPTAVPPTPHAGNVPPPPSIPAPVPQLGFVPTAETGAGESGPGQKLYVVPIGTAMPPAGGGTRPAAPDTSPAAVLDVEPMFPRAEPGPRRRSFVDITAAPCFGHAPDYHWLSGQVEYSRILHAWRLRYASVDESDRFAGSVTLVENAHVGYLRDGEYVRVVGHLVNPDADGPAPAYRIESFQVIDNPNDPGTTPVQATENAGAPETTARTKADEQLRD